MCVLIVIVRRVLFLLLCSVSILLEPWFLNFLPFFLSFFCLFINDMRLFLDGVIDTNRARWIPMHRPVRLRRTTPSSIRRRPHTLRPMMRRVNRR